MVANKSFLTGQQEIFFRLVGRAELFQWVGADPHRSSKNSNCQSDLVGAGVGGFQK